MIIRGHAGMLGADPAATEGLPPILELPPADGEMVHRFMRKRVRSDAWSSESMVAAQRAYGRQVQQAEREKAAAALTLVQAERDSARHQEAGLRTGLGMATEALRVMTADRDALRALEPTSRAGAVLGQMQAERDAMQQERDELRKDRDLEKKIRKDYVDALEVMREERDELRAALEELLSLRGIAEEFPILDRGLGTATPAGKALLRARAALTPKATQQETRA